MHEVYIECFRKKIVTYILLNEFHMEGDREIYNS